MLKITVSKPEQYDEIKDEFIPEIKEQVLLLEHSLVSISKWESKWCKPFLSRGEKTFEESVDYIRCMTITQNVNESVYSEISNSHIVEVTKYIEAPMTAYTFPKDKTSPNREIITSEVIYYWMAALGIPFECEKWHLNRLLSLINVCKIRNNPPKKMGRNEVMSRNTALNAARRQSLNTSG